MDMMFTYENEAMAAFAAAAAAASATTIPMAFTTEQAATGGVTTPMDEDPAGSSFFYIPHNPMFFDMFSDPAMYNLTCYNMDVVTLSQQYAPMIWSTTNDNMPQPPPSS